MNKPYVKQYNEVGELLNPIERYYESKMYLGIRKGLIQNTVVPYYYPNRKERRTKNEVKPGKKTPFQNSFLDNVWLKIKRKLRMVKKSRNINHK